MITNQDSLENLQQIRTENRANGRDSKGRKKESAVGSSLFKEKKKKKEKVVITGDDILIEYVRRLKNAVIKQKQHGFDFPNTILYYLEKFLHHKVWLVSDKQTQ